MVNSGEARQVREIFDLYLRHNSIMPVVHELDRLGWHTKRWKTEAGRERGGKPFIKKAVYMHGPHVHGARAEAVPLLGLLQRPAEGMEVVRDEIGLGTGHRDGSPRQYSGAGPERKAP